MGISRRFRFRFSAVLLGLFSSVAQANLVVDGGFELPVAGPGGVDSGYLNFTVGQTIDSVWTVVGPVSVLSDVSVYPGTETHPPATYTVQEGLQALDLTGDFDNGAALGVEQVIPTIAGTQYTLSYYVGHFDINAGGGSIATVVFKLNGNVVQTASNSNNSSNAVNWQLFTDTFTASGPTTTLDFINGTPAGTLFGGLDNVQVNATPEPSTPILVGMGLMATLLVRRRIWR